MNILDLLPLLPEVIQLLLQKFEFFLYWILPFLYGILGILFCFWIVSGIVERVTYHLQKTYSVNFGRLNTFSTFLFHQSLGFNHNSDHFWCFLYGKYIL